MKSKKHHKVDMKSKTRDYIVYFLNLLGLLILERFPIFLVNTFSAGNHRLVLWQIFLVILTLTLAIFYAISWGKRQRLTEWRFQNAKLHKKEIIVGFFVLLGVAFLSQFAVTGIELLSHSRLSTSVNQQLINHASKLVPPLLM